MATMQITGRQIKDGSITDDKVAIGANIDSSKLAAWSEARDAGNQKLTNLAAGVAANDAATIQQLEDKITASAAGLSMKIPARVASTANVGGSYSATSGASARGQFTGMPTVIDGVTLAANDRILLKNQTSAAENGIWVVSTLGSGSNGIWDRALDADGDGKIVDGTSLFVGEGTVNATTQWVMSTDGPIIVGGSSGSSLNWILWGAGKTYNDDGVTTELNGQAFSVRDSGISSAKLASNAVITAKLAANAVTGAKIAFIDQEVTGSVNGVNTSFTMSATPTAASLIVWVRGIRQRPTTHYTTSGATLSFVTAPETGDDIAVFGMAAS